MFLNPNFFKIDARFLNAKKGSILISEPFADDRYFGRSLVLLTEHNDEGTVGFVLNKKLPNSVNNALNIKHEQEIPLYLGGPVDTEKLYFIHTFGDKLPGSIHIKANLYWGGDIDILKLMLQTSNPDLSQIRFFAGYAGWQPNQLQSELQRNFWVVKNQKSIDSVLSFPPNIWEISTSNLGGKYKLWSNLPKDPNLN